MPLDAAPPPPAWYRHAPYLLFFPLGGLMSLLGVLPWTAFALGLGGWRPELHAITEVQSALTSFAVGFLFTFIPRRTGTAAPRSVECFGAVALVIAPALLALGGFGHLAHAVWALLALFLGGFVLVRIPHALKTEKAVAQLLWMPVAFGMGVVGAGMAALAGPGRPAWLGPLGTSLVWQGVLGGLVMGVGGMLLPMMFHREPHRGDRSPRAWVLHGMAAALFVGSFAVEVGVGLRTGYALRALVTLAVLGISARLWRWPRVQGLHRRLGWMAAWMLPVGFACVAIWPAHQIAMLHLVFLSGFGMLTLAVANHVIVAHGGRDPLLMANPVPLFVMGAAIALALVARILVSVDLMRMLLWLGAASSLYLVALIAWASWIVPRLKPVSPYENDKLPSAPTTREAAAAK